MRKLKGPLPTVEKGQQKHFLLAMQVLWASVFQVFHKLAMRWGNQYRSQQQPSLTQSATAESSCVLSFTSRGKPRLTHLCTPWGLGLYKTWQRHSFLSHRGRVWEPGEKEAASDSAPLQPHLLPSFSPSLPCPKSCSAHHGHPAQGLDALTNSWQVIE